jgi:hypothetical protein
MLKGNSLSPRYVENAIGKSAQTPCDQMAAAFSALPTV